MLAKCARMPTHGTSSAPVIAPTIGTGMSRSSIGSAALPPALRARDETAASRRPRKIGTTSCPSVHSAATPMTPAPMKRTSCAHTASAASAAEPGVP